MIRECIFDFGCELVVFELFELWFRLLVKIRVLDRCIHLIKVTMGVPPHTEPAP
jgi:hypothetical protein